MEALEFGGYLKNLRKGRKMTIRKLEMVSTVSNAYISQIERGERGIPSPEILKKLAKPLGVEYEELMEKAGYIEENKKVDEDLEATLVFHQMKEAMLDSLKQTSDPHEKERLKKEVQEWADLIGIDDFMKNIDLTDENLEENYNFLYKGKPLEKEKVKKILSYIRFVAQEE